MIPRATRRLEAKLSVSRQCLPRPARLYSSPSKRNEAPATATAHAQPPPDFPVFDSNFLTPSSSATLSTSPSSYEVAGTPLSQLISQYLDRKPQLTILPTPLPPGSASVEGYDRWFKDSKSQDMAGIINACLHNLYDVPRAKHVFERLRQKAGTSILGSKLYNSILHAYMGMAVKDPTKKNYWVEEAWKLYNIMESGQDDVQPSVRTYSIILALWHTHTPGTLDNDFVDGARSPGVILNKMAERGISVSAVIANPSILPTKIATDIRRTLSNEAVNQGFHDIVKELGQVESIDGNKDPLQDVPQVNPVYNHPKPTVVDGVPVEPKPYVPFNLDSLRRHLSDITEARSALDSNVHARQRHLEASVYDLAVEMLQHRFNTMEQRGLTTGRLFHAELQHLMWQWHLALQGRVRTEIERIISEERSKSSNAMTPIGPFLTLVKPEKLSLLTILEVMRLQGSGGVVYGMKMTRALIAVGKAVENEYKAEMCRLHDIPVPHFSRRNDGFFTKLGYKHLHQRRIAAALTNEDGEGWTAAWTQVARAKVGAVLVECLMDVAQVERTSVARETGELITELQPAFYNAYEYQRGQKLGVLRLNTAISERLAKDSLSQTIHPRHLPMLVKPKPWLNYDDGGYIYNKSHAMRFKDSSEQELYLKEATNAGTVELVYAGLDVLGSTPWKINKAIFDVVITVWNSGERMGKMPPAVYDQPEPEAPENIDYDLEARSHHLIRHRAWAQAKANTHSERCNVNYKVEIARAFLGDTFYFPHNLDFRGRAYPIPPHLSHIGDDLSRGLLQFEQAKPLGVRGLRWLKIHLANLYGYDKANFDERVHWVEEHLADIYDSAEKPLEGQRWWSKADDPWQCLATCMELRNALESEDPTKYPSSLPVHQDGTCNGLQHYAALGGDDQGARQVNLAAADRPSDVYTHVSLEVQKAIDIDAAQGHPTALLLQGRVSRKVVKQTVMTTVYGVTFVGARAQIERQLRDLHAFPQEKVWGAASYLAKLVIATIGGTFKGAKHIQQWLNLCARLISKSIPEDRLRMSRNSKGETIISIPKAAVKKEQMTTVIWTTPLGLPIVQPYRKIIRKQIKTSIQSVYISDPNANAEVNGVKQASAFPPNFIHSLDATHMMLTALECRNRDLTYASVHDSYWTHACDIDKMSEIIRETFIALHSSDILGKLEEEFRERYKSHKVPLDNIGGKKSVFVKTLHAAGSRIMEIRRQSEVLALSKNVRFEDLSQPRLSSADAIDQQNALDPDLDLLASLNEETLDDEDEDETDADTKLLAGKFVNLTDLLPPLPAKGNFKVEAIKGSQYFFS